MQKCMAAVAIAALLPAVASAESLRDAIALAYETNPVLRSQRAAQRAVDEEYEQAMAGYRPTVSISGQIGYQYADLDQQSFVGGYTTSHQQADTGQVDLSLVQPLYTGGAVRARVNSASADILAGRESLRRTEGQLLLQVVTAYMDVQRDRETLQILAQETSDLQVDYTEVQAQGALGQVTRTDVAQAEGRLLNVQVQIEQARAKLGASQSTYLDLVGQSPGALESEPDLKNVPATVDQAFDVAEASNPQLRGAIQTELAARSKVSEAKAASAPNLSFRIDGAIAPIAPYIPREYDRSVTAGISYSQNFYTGGYNGSKIREAIERDNKAALDIESTRRDVVQSISQAWDLYRSAKRSLDLQQSLLKSEALALQGEQVEHRAGLRTTIDLLNAELELSTAKLGFVQSRHDAYVASASLLNDMGLLEVRFLYKDLALYRPEASMQRRARNNAMPLDGVAGWLDKINAPAAPAPISSSLSAGGRRPSGEAIPDGH